MQSQSDAQLLRDYAERRAEAVFTELVHRHTNLVYAAALRQVNSADLAAEIAQNVFLALARAAAGLAPRLTEEASLAGWLCRATRNLSLNHRRDESRRQHRERQAMTEFLDQSEDQLDWEQLRPFLDDAMVELSEPEFDAVVLRYFQNQDLRSVGRALGVSDAAARWSACAKSSPNAASPSAAAASPPSSPPTPCKQRPPVWLRRFPRTSRWPARPRPPPQRSPPRKLSS